MTNEIGAAKGAMVNLRRAPTELEESAGLLADVRDEVESKWHWRPLEDHQTRLMHCAEHYFRGLETDEAIIEAESLLLKLDQVNQEFAVALIKGDAVILDLTTAFPVGSNVGVTDLSSYPSAMDQAGFKLIGASDEVTTWPKESKKGEPEPRKSTVHAIWLSWKYRRIYRHGMQFKPASNSHNDVLNLWDEWGTPPRDLTDKERNNIRAMAPDYEAFPFPDLGEMGNGNLDAEAMGCAMFLNHLIQNICEGDKEVFQYILSWAADIVQDPLNKKGVALSLGGKMGTGKTIFSDYIGDVVGRRYTATVSDKNALVGTFNAHLAGKMLIQSEEATFGGDKAAENALKHRITGSNQHVNEKFMPAQYVPCYARVIFTGNDLNRHSISSDDRRYMLLDVGEGRLQDHAYFSKLRAQMADMGGLGLQCWANIMHRWKTPDHVNLRQPLRTAAYDASYEASIPPHARYFHEALKTGENWPLVNGGPIALKDVQEDWNGWLDAEKVPEGKWGKRTTPGIVRSLMLEYWGIDPESQRRDRLPGRPNKDQLFDLPSLKAAREWAAAPQPNGLGLTQASEWESIYGDGSD
jgi:hypothetical protein